MTEMRDAMAANGGTISRNPGGFWRVTIDGKPSAAWFGATTISALVRRGVLAYSKMQPRGNGGGSFPIEAKLAESVGVGAAGKE